MNKTEINYEISRDMISREIEEFEHDPRGFLESMGWKCEDKYKKIAEDEELDFSVEDIEKIAGMQDCERKEGVTNMVAGKIIIGAKDL